jgi:hypothetical protein
MTTDEPWATLVPAAGSWLTIVPAGMVGLFSDAMVSWTPAAAAWAVARATVVPTKFGATTTLGRVGTTQLAPVTEL